MPEGWEWDETLYRGSAAHYRRGRLPYPPGLADAVRDALALDGTGRLLDVGTGPGIVALELAGLFEEVVGVDADADMLAEAARSAARRGVGHAAWVRARAEQLPPDLGRFRAATFAQSFHWMDRPAVAAAVRDLLVPGGAFVQISAWSLHGDPALEPTVRTPPHAAVQDLLQQYLGRQRRAGQGVLRHGTPGDEAEVLAAAGFRGPRIVEVPGGQVVDRAVDDLVACVYSVSGSAPHLFGERLAEFDRDLRALLTERRPSDGYREILGPAEVRVWTADQ